MLKDFEDLKSAGVPLKELTQNPNSGFAEFSSSEDVLTLLKQLKKEGFNSLKTNNIGNNNIQAKDGNGEIQSDN